MPTFVQHFLKPGRYHIGGDEFMDLTADELAQYVDGTRRIIDAGYRPPVLLEHALPGSKEGSPVAHELFDIDGNGLGPNQNAIRRDKRANQMRNTVGWVDSVSMCLDGGAVWTLEIGDPDVMKKLDQGIIRFTSPELRGFWVDGNGQRHVKFFAHCALTHRPRAINQGPIESVGAMQFSLEDFQPFSLSRRNQPMSQRSTARPLRPLQLSTDADEVVATPQQLAAVVERLAKLGLVLPADTSNRTLVRDLLTALKTYEGTLARIQANRRRDQDDDEPIREDRNPAATMQFSADSQAESAADAGRRQAEAHVARTLAFREAGKLTGSMTPQKAYERQQLEKQILDRAWSK